ncbi:choice-of-anchor Q domain-containing protein [Granulicella sp. S190]|uniref:choice-of-anchor Q domain-containing protein n=1 Tax=Granulicella sp. S190 TaxID=1747226 RepID=UPI00131E4FE0|nr:choice-of-anchor Q domain-containing protein [Granulicella sp. S190]
MRSRVLWILLLLLVALPLSGETWFVRKDGGTRYSAKKHNGQCDGKADAAYDGKGANQHCAFKDVRFLWDDLSSHDLSWVIAGGDTVIIRNGPWRIGYEQGAKPYDAWCSGQGDPYACSNPTIPAGTAAQHTRILGENYASCSDGVGVTDRSKLTQLYGGHGVWSAINLRGAKFVDIQCIDLTRHSQCIRIGSPALPSGCNTSYPLDDYASNGIITDVNTHDILLQDMWIHGFVSRGIIGPIGGTVTANRVNIAYNGGAGWDFDDGNSTPNRNGTINLTYTTIEWNGCNQAYPGPGVISCYSQSSGGYGDGIGTATGTCLSAHVDHSTFRYNTQDGYDMLHNDKGNCSMSITNSTAYGNNGAQFKWGPNDSPMVFNNNTVLGNCLRLSQPFPGAPQNYNANLSDFCRAEDAIAFGFRDGGSLFMANNTIVSYSPTTLDVSCWGTFPQNQGDGTCANSTLTFKNNIVMGIDNPKTYNLGGKPGGPGAFYNDQVIGHIVRSNNLYYNVRGLRCPTGQPGEHCADPKFISLPRFNTEQDLDKFDFRLSDGSPALHAGTSVPQVQTDIDGKPRPSSGNYDLGAHQH